ncbi:hypothetical protein D7030_11000 [Flavobacteriaceae bacterium AU392]|nr:hypothetical protein D1817_13670 [Flavobacteriaceae bacterium]RKM82687.1 hypothetical protein D7030_11000 [Flavobacteriaceae bacterium AU392]
MKKIILIITIMFSYTDFYGQEQKFRFPVWISYAKNTDIAGISLSAFPTDLINETNYGNTRRTFGLHTEVFLLSPFYFLAPRSPLSTSDKDYEFLIRTGTVNQKIYGFNLTTGSFELIDSHGITITGFLHYSRKNDGIAIAGISNHIERANGLIISTLGNEAYKSNGILIGFGNTVNYFNGLQLGGFNEIETKGVGVQIGVFNKAKNHRGIQLGLWNKNDKRSFPIINWNFKG